jgi:hypothetical protein
LRLLIPREGQGGEVDRLPPGNDGLDDLGRQEGQLKALSD